MRLVLTERVREKLTHKHDVTRTEVVQCFGNKVGKLLEDTREQHRADPPTKWFIAETDSGRELKVTFVMEEGVVFLKSAYEPNAAEKRIYNNKAL